MYTQLITSEIKKAFEGVDVPVYPSTGNHDTWPVNNQDFNEPNSNYPINHFVDDWKEWIGDEAAEEFAKYGYCSIPFKLPGGKLLEGSRVLIMQIRSRTRVTSTCLVKSTTQLVTSPGSRNN